MDTLLYHLELLALSAISEEVLAVLKSPYSVWCNYNVYQKQRFFSFIFESNLVYDKFEGYRTPNYSLPIRVFEEISTSNPVQVEVSGIEPESESGCESVSTTRSHRLI